MQNYDVIIRRLAQMGEVNNILDVIRSHSREFSAQNSAAHIILIKHATEAETKENLLGNQIWAEATAKALVELKPLNEEIKRLNVLKPPSNPPERAGKVLPNSGKNPPKRPPMKGTTGYDGPTGLDTRVEARLKKMGFGKK